MQLGWYIIIFLLICGVLVSAKDVYITRAIKSDFKTISKNSNGEITTNILSGYYAAYNNYSNRLSQIKSELADSDRKVRRMNKKIAEIEKILEEIEVGRSLYLKIIEDYVNPSKFDNSTTIFSRDLRTYLSKSGWNYIKKEI